MIINICNISGWRQRTRSRISCWRYQGRSWCTGKTFSSLTNRQAKKQTNLQASKKLARTQTNKHIFFCCCCVCSLVTIWLMVVYNIYLHVFKCLHVMFNLGCKRFPRKPWKTWTPSKYLSVNYIVVAFSYFPLYLVPHFKHNLDKFN